MNLQWSVCSTGFIVSLCACDTTVDEKQKIIKETETFKPNILFILIDDLGYKDLGCYGSDFYETPNIDRLAQSGVRFTNAYAASAVSSPTRASILTGKNPDRLHLTDWTGPAAWHPTGKLNTPPTEEVIPHKEYTLAEVLGDNGYTSCYLGKWHLGDGEYMPDNYGFDKVIGAINAGAPPSYFYPYFRANWEGTGWPTQISDLAATGKEGEYLTDRLTSEAMNFLDTIGERPFFLYLAHYAVHMPMEGKAHLVEKYRKKAKKMYSDTLTTLVKERNNSYTRVIQNHAVYAAMIESVDESVGNLLAKLNEQKLSDNTIVIFTSDNGGYTTSNFPLPVHTPDTAQKLPTSVMPYRAGKGWYYEGGIKIPTIVYWPKVTKANSTVDKPIISTDFFPTLLEMTGVRLLPEQHVDGVSFASILSGTEKNTDGQVFFWHYPHYHNSGQTPASVIRRGRYKLIFEYEQSNTYLYDLEKDISENNNLATTLPQKRDALLQELKERKAEVNARVPEKEKK